MKTTVRFTWNQLRIFDAVARLSSHTRAAAELHVVQPTISAQIKQLSAAVGMPLFEQIGEIAPRFNRAVLYRSNAQSRVIETALFNASVPYRVYGGLRFFERAEIKHALAYLRLLENPRDDTSFLRVVNFPPRGIGARSGGHAAGIAPGTRSAHCALRRAACRADQSRNQSAYARATISAAIFSQAEPVAEWWARQALSAFVAELLQYRP